ncbi:cytochrome protein [Penicillium argentinense]|uniref:Cytochrome protein n=1 Tax=Penicillium argentinense TaxID=1131581 RepID=A0A9W9G4S5_9EURO|nr:cytochrome protein [Penicillium argentinense]KAJ5112136.1 cytochrome protein [Penicillium argentinense]
MKLELVSELGTWENAVLAVYALLAALPLWYLTTFFISPLRRFPGPPLAGWTNLWRMFHVRQGRYHLVIHELHKKYGPVVRIAPNVLDLDIPELTKTIYNTKAEYLKTEFYHGSSAKSNGKIIYNLFSECKPDVHALHKRPISKYYSMNGVLPLETHIDEMIAYFCQRLEENFMDGSNATESFRLEDWIAYYTWDVVGKATFSQPIGYLEKGYDFDHTLSTADTAMDYFTMVGQMPILDHLLDKNPVWRIGPPSFGNITNISIQHLMDRLQGKDTHYHNPSKPDFLDKFIEAKEKYPDVVDDMQIVSYLMINMIAGADTTGITLNAALYFSLKNPRVWNRLRAEFPARCPSDPPVVSYKSAREVPYLDAVVREAMRCHPGVAMLLERYVPNGGLNLPNGQHVPAGAVVGMNPYVTGRNKSVWGEDAEEFRPERWLRDQTRETEEAFQKRLQLMNNTDLTFGGGSRVCIGKHFGLLEVYKVIATLVSRYDVELVHPERDWETHNSFFVRQSGIEVRMSPRGC